MNPCLNSAEPGPPPYPPPAVPTVGRRPAASPRPAPALPSPSYQVCVSVPSPGLRPSPPPSALPEDGAPDLECWVCYSHFNNVFRCPKMLECRHTFCLECLARINVKSAQAAAIRCPLCRRVTPLPALGLPRLATDCDVLASLPPAMRRVCSVRFQRSKGKLQVKRAMSHSHRGREEKPSVKGEPGKAHEAEVARLHQSGTS